MKNFVAVCLFIAVLAFSLPVGADEGTTQSADAQGSSASQEQSQDQGQDQDQSQGEIDPDVLEATERCTQAGAAIGTAIILQNSLKSGDN